MKRSFWRLARLTFGGSLIRNARSGDKRGSLLEEVSYETLIFTSLRSTTEGCVFQNDPRNWCQTAVPESFLFLCVPK